MTGAADAGTPFDVAEVRPADTRDYSMAMFIVLTIITGGIWGMVCFYKIARRYRRLAAVPATPFELLFWGWIALMALAWFREPLHFGRAASAALSLAIEVASTWLLFESMTLRDAARCRIAPVGTTQPAPVFKSRTWHVGMHAGPWFIALAVDASGDALERNKVAPLLDNLWVVAALAVLLGALALWIWQAIKFFDEWNAVAYFLRQRQREAKSA